MNDSERRFQAGGTTGMDSRQRELLDFVLGHRARRLSTPARESEPDGERYAYGQWNETIPVIRDGRIRESDCGLDWGGQFGHALGYEWGMPQQEAFEELLTQYLDVERLDRLVQELGVHWVNASDAVFFHELVAPGIAVVLHELGKGKVFRGLRDLAGVGSREIVLYPPPSDRDRRVAEARITRYERPATLGDSRFPVEDRPVRASYRAPLIAARGMCEYFSRTYDPPDLHEMTCAVCGDMFWPQAHDSRSLSRIGSVRYCIQCLFMRTRDTWTMDDATRESAKVAMITAAQAMFDAVGVVPSSGYASTILAGLPDLTRDAWLTSMIVLPSPSTATAIFGSWAHYLEEAGLLEKASRAPRGGYRSIAADGHLALSLGERFVCDWMQSHGIAHSKEPTYPSHPDFNPDGRLRADWLVGDCWVELAGRMGDEEYRRRMEVKRLLAAAEGLRHLVILPHELPALEAVAALHWRYGNASTANTSTSTPSVT